MSDLRVDTKHLIEHVTYGVRDNPPRRTGGHLYGVVPSRGWKTWFREEDGPERILKMLDETLNDPEFMVAPGGAATGVAWLSGLTGTCTRPIGSQRVAGRSSCRSILSAVEIYWRRTRQARYTTKPGRTIET